jgi:hypothetical protein
MKKFFSLLVIEVEVFSSFVRLKMKIEHNAETSWLLCKKKENRIDAVEEV